MRTTIAPWKSRSCCSTPIKDYALQDKTALADFPGTTEELSQVRRHHLRRLRPAAIRSWASSGLHNLVEFVSGGSGKGKEHAPQAGRRHPVRRRRQTTIPHAYKGTPLAEILPVIPGDRPAEDDFRDQKFHLKWTPSGRQHQIFKFTADEGESQNIWLQPGPALLVVAGLHGRPYRRGPGRASKPKSGQSRAGQDKTIRSSSSRFVGSGRTMFFGFDESWRWRFREDELRYNDLLDPDDSLPVAAAHFAYRSAPQSADPLSPGREAESDRDASPTTCRCRAG